MRIAIRTDASLEIGTGHVMRCLTLADELRERGASILFICRTHAGNLSDLIETRGYRVIRLPRSNIASNNDASPHSTHQHWLGTDWQTDARETSRALAEESPWDWLVVDHYALTNTWETNLRKRAKRIFVIDDLEDRNHDCDLLLDQNLHSTMEHRYESLVPDSCAQMLGPKFALLRPEFRIAREKFHRVCDKVMRILVFFGGADPYNYTTLALDALDKARRPDIHLDVIVGYSNPHIRSLKERITRTENAEIHVQASNMAQLMAQADLAIGAAGTATWERCCVGLPTIACAIAENQIQGLNGAAEQGILCGIVPDDISVTNLSVHIQTLINNPALRGHLAQRGRETVDGDGARRVANRIMAPIISLRLATEADSELLYRWRNHPDIRSVSRDSSVIDRGQHYSWVQAVISDPFRCLLIGISGEQEIGAIRFDISSCEAEISLYLAPELKGKGLGHELLSQGELWLRKQYPEISAITAQVLSDNQASRNLFIDHGYTLNTLRFNKGLTQ